MLIGVVAAGLVVSCCCADRVRRHGELAAPDARHLPAAGRGAGHPDAARRRGRRWRGTRAGSRSGPRSSMLLLSLVAVGPIRSDRRPASSSSSRRSGCRTFHIAYHLGIDGISLFFVLLSTLPDADLHRCRAGSSITRAGQGIHDRLPGPRDDDGRHVLRARFRRLLHVLRGRADPDVPHHRRLGRAAAGLFRVQVLPLHAASARC